MTRFVIAGVLLAAGLLLNACGGGGSMSGGDGAVCFTCLDDCMASSLCPDAPKGQDCAQICKKQDALDKASDCVAQSEAFLCCRHNHVAAVCASLNNPCRPEIDAYLACTNTFCSSRPKPAGC